MAITDRVTLHKHLDRLDLEELRTLCYYLDVAYDDLRGEGKSAKARELLLFLERHDQLDRLFTIIEQTGSEQPTLKNRYAAYLRYQYGHVPLGGIAPRVQDQALSIPLNELFVPLQAEPDAPLHTQYTISGTRGYQPQRAMDPRLVGLDEVIAHRCVVILGEPGSGKSTFLRWLIAKALEAAEIAKVNNGDVAPESLPIFVRLVNFASALERQPNLTLAQFIQNYHLPEYQSLFKWLLAIGRGWLLLDGLDEVADPYLRRQVREAVQTFAAQFSNFQMVVTSRIVGYRNAQLHSGFRQFTLQPFSLDEIALFIHNWHRAVQRLNTDPVDLADADQRAKLLLEKIKGKPRIIQLASTPLLLAIIALMDWKGKELPNRRVELYRVAIETLLEDWPAEQGRPIQNELGMSEMLGVLAPLAFQMFAAGFNDAILRQDLEQRLIQLVQEIRGCSKIDAQNLARRWLPTLSEHSGLLLDAGVDEFQRPIFAFLHLSFVEYLAGRALAQQWRNHRTNLLAYTNDPRWREVILLMAGEIGMDSAIEATRLVEEIEQMTPPHHDVLQQSLVLASACLADDIPVVSPTQSRILSKLVTQWHKSASGLLRSKLFRILAAMRSTDSAHELIKQLMPLLNDKQEWVRSSVLELLGKLGSPSDPKLQARILSCLGDTEDQVRHAAVRAIEALELASVPDIRQLLLRLLDEPNSNIRTRAVLALRTVADRDKQVQLSLIQALTTGTSAATRQMAARVLSVVRQPDKELVDRMFDTLGDPNSGVRKEAATTFLYWGEDKREYLLVKLKAILYAPDSEQKHAFLRITSDIGVVLGSSVTTLLIEVAEGEPELSVRSAAIRALGYLQTTDKRVIHVLINALSNPNRPVRRHAVQGLKQLAVRSTDVTIALSQAFEDPDPAVQKAAAEALGRCGVMVPTVISALEKALTNDNEFVRLCVAQALVGMGSRLSTAHDVLMTALKSTNGEVRRRAAQELRSIVHHLSASVIAVLVDLLADSNRDVREHSTRTLAELGAKADLRVVAACRSALHDDYHQVRAYAAEALGHFGRTDNETIAALLTALADSNPRVRLAASESLITLGSGIERETIISKVRTLLDQQPRHEDVLNTLWGLVVGE